MYCTGHAHSQIADSVADQNRGAAQGLAIDLPHSVCAPVTKAGTASICMTIFYMLYEQCLICFVKLDAAYELTYAWHFATVLPAASASTLLALTGLRMCDDPA